MFRSLVFTLCLGTFAFAGEFGVGSKVENIAVDDHGKSVTIVPAKSTATVVLFTSVQCPVSNAYNDRMAALHKDYAGKPVQFVFVNANAGESVDAIDSHAKAHFPFQVYKDLNNVLADKYNAQSTPEAYIFDKSGTLVYHGHIDDAQNEAKVDQKSLRKALDSVLGGEKVQTAETKAFGCTIKRVKKTS